MRQIVYVAVIFLLPLLCCEPAPGPRDGYGTEYFCFDGYRGIGVASVPISGTASYVIPVAAEPVAGAEEIASFRAEISSQALTFSVESDAIAEDAFFEFAYEHPGLPVESFEGDWIKVRIGYDPSGEPKTGWIENTAPLIVETWDAYLPARAAFLATCDKPSLYKVPGGDAFFPDVSYVYDDIAKTKRPDYRIRHLETDGDWMRVELVTPSDLCGQLQDAVRTEGWVRFLLEDGSPAVWYYTRGC